MMPEAEGGSQPARERAAKHLSRNAIVSSAPAQRKSEPNKRLYELALWLAVRRTPRDELGPGAKLCWDVIARWERQDMECWKGLLRMAHEVGVTESQASRYLAELESKKYIETTVGQAGKPVYRRLPQLDLETRATKIHQELTAHGDRGAGPEGV